MDRQSGPTAFVASALSDFGPWNGRKGGLPESYHPRSMHRRCCLALLGILVRYTDDSNGENRHDDVHDDDDGECARSIQVL